MSDTPPDPSLTLRPIGYVRSGKHVKFQTLHQPAESAEERSLIELLPDQDYELALRDLAGFSRIWLVWWFHKNPNWRPLVLPPRGPAQRRGLFATSLVSAVAAVSGWFLAVRVFGASTMEEWTWVLWSLAASTLALGGFFLFRSKR